MNPISRAVETAPTRPLCGIVVRVVVCVVSVVVRHTEGIRVARANAGDRVGGIIIALVEISGVVEREIATQRELAVGRASWAEVETGYLGFEIL